MLGVWNWQLDFKFLNAFPLPLFTIGVKMGLGNETMATQQLWSQATFFNEITVAFQLACLLLFRWCKQNCRDRNIVQLTNCPIENKYLIEVDLRNSTFLGKLLNYIFLWNNLFGGIRYFLYFLFVLFLIWKNR